MKKISLSIILVFFLVIPMAWGAVIFQDNFDSDVDQVCDNTLPGSWSRTSSCISGTYGGVTHSNYEINAPGRGGSGKSFKIWKASNVFATQQFSCIDLVLSPGYTELYTRFYMKVPSAMESNAALDYLKMGRYNLSEGSNGIYVNFVGWGGGTSKFSNVARIVVYGYKDPVGWRELLSNAEFPRDDNWHCYEFRFKLNTPGMANGIAQLWLDGVLKGNITDFDLRANAGEYFTTAMGVGGGNSNDGVVWQNSWRGIEFDDYVLSTTYVGPGVLSTSYGGPAADTTAPNRPQGLKILQ